MNRFGQQILLVILVASLTAFSAYAGTVHGTVINRTTGKPASDVPVTLLNPTAGMVEVGSAKSDAQGQFTVTNDAIGMGPILIRATFHDNSFNTFLPPGRPEVQVDIFETSKDPKIITPDSRIVIFQPNGDKLIGAEEYHVQNNSNPPVAYFRTEGNFDFAIPEKATLQQVSTVSSLGMGVPQASIDKGKGRFAIAYPFRPGETSVRLSYELAYPGNAASVQLPATYGGLKLLVVAPPGVTVAGDGLKPAGQEQGMMVYTHDPLPAKSSLAVMLSGVGNPQAASAEGQQGGQEGNSRTESENVQAVPGRLDDLKWPLMIGLAVLFGFGAVLLSRKQVLVAEGPTGEVEVAPTAQRKPPAKAAKPAPARPVAPPAASTPAPPVVATPEPAKTVAEVNAQVSVSLDSLKDTIFRLELRKQAGTISEADYARERARVEKLLRDLVQG